jgi:hypothetical protein
MFSYYSAASPPLLLCFFLLVGVDRKQAKMVSDRGDTLIYLWREIMRGERIQKLLTTEDDHHSKDVVKDLPCNEKLASHTYGFVVM